MTAENTAEREIVQETEFQVFRSPNPTQSLPKQFQEPRKSFSPKEFQLQLNSTSKEESQAKLKRDFKTLEGWNSSAIKEQPPNQQGASSDHLSASETLQKRSNLFFLFFFCDFVHHEWLNTFLF